MTSVVRVIVFTKIQKNKMSYRNFTEKKNDTTHKQFWLKRQSIPSKVPTYSVRYRENTQLKQYYYHTRTYCLLL